LSNSRPLSPRRPMLSAEVVAGFKRGRLLDALAIVLAERGYRATTVAAVVKQAGAARNTFYDHYGSLEAIFLDLVERSQAQLFERVEGACAQAGAGASGMEQGLGAALGWLGDEPLAARALLIEAGSSTPRALNLQLAATNRFVDLLRTAMPTGPAWTDTTEDLLVGGLASILRGLVLAGETDRARDLLPGLVQFVWQPYLKD
jgi:AcrR family transcriptional regulator